MSLAMSLAACTKKVVQMPSPVSQPEAYCPYLPSKTFTPAVTVTGTAKYQFRIDGNKAVDTTGLPIRYAEVMVKNSAGAIVQCAETSSTGTFAFQLPANSGAYTVQVNSRANNTSAKAYVMDNPTDNTYYSIGVSNVDSSADASVALTASATGTLEGGPFNILDKIVAANVFLRTYTTTAEGCTFSDCTAFSVAPLAHVYWTKGLNPNTYLGGSSASGVSFYLQGTNELYILGGIDGDVDFSDCDHFDNSIILHEYGHFIENYYGVSDSPGGHHGPNTIIDPRLAWSEAWANFFQAAVTGNPLYRDTEGNYSCSNVSPTSCSGPFHDENLETYENYDDTISGGVIAANEGNFHEFAITRALWDGLDPHPVSGRNTPVGSAGNSVDDTVNSDFAEIWTVVAGGTNGFRSSGNRFRNVGLFHKIQQSLTGATDWSSIRTAEKQSGNQSDFATPVTVPGTCGTTSIQAQQQTNGSFADSNLFLDNDFYAFYHSSGSLTVRLDYTPGGANPADLDLIIWKDGYKYGDATDALGYSRDSRLSDGGTEEVIVTAPAGWYMINVMVNPAAVTGPGGGSASTYNIYINGQKACPNP